MPKIGETSAPQAEQSEPAPEAQIAKLKTEIGEDLQPIREAVSAGDITAVKKLYKRLISKYHQDKFEGNKAIKDAMQPINVAINSINNILKGDLPLGQQLPEIQKALTAVEQLAGGTKTAAGEAGPEATEADIETETGLISQELAEIGRECQQTYEAMQSADHKMQSLQNLQASLEGLSPEFRAAHQQEIQKIYDSYAELRSKLTALEGRYTQTQMQMSFFSYYQTEKMNLQDAPQQALEMSRQAEEIQKLHAGNAAEFERENRTAETLNRQMERYQTQYQSLQNERMTVARWQAHLDQQFYAIAPFDPQYQTKINENRRQKQQYDFQDAQLYAQMNEVVQTINSLSQQQAQNTFRRQQLWQEKLQLEARGGQLHQARITFYENTTFRQGALTAARTNISQTVRERRKGRAETRPEAGA